MKLDILSSLSKHTLDSDLELVSQNIFCPSFAIKLHLSLFLNYAYASGKWHMTFAVSYKITYGSNMNIWASELFQTRRLHTIKMYQYFALSQATYVLHKGFFQ